MKLTPRPIARLCSSLFKLSAREVIDPVLMNGSSVLRHNDEQTNHVPWYSRDDHIRSNFMTKDIENVRPIVRSEEGRPANVESIQTLWERIRWHRDEVGLSQLTMAQDDRVSWFANRI